MCTHVHGYLWRTEVDTWYLSQLFPPYTFEVGSLIEPQAQQFCEIGWLLSFGDCLSRLPASIAGVTFGYHHTQLFNSSAQYLMLL